MRVLRISTAALCLTLLPALVFAQASITGVVKDSSGAVLPGVTVEASSPALLEKVRTAVTDGNGVYLITELRPGPYKVTFTLTGFNTVVRDGINLTGAFTASVDGEMRVGALEETITVTGEAPIVDVSSTTRQRVMDQEAISTLPTGRNMFNLGVLIPGITISTGGLASQDVGGALGPETRALAAHGGRTEDQRFMMNGVSLSSMIGGGWGGGAIPNATGVQEIVFDTASVSADLATGGVRINFIAREGGNQYHGTLFGNFANGSMQSANVDEALRLRNPLLSNAGKIDKNWDFNPGFGGPLKRDKVWFYASGRSQGAYLFAQGMYFNRNHNDPTKWTYEADTENPASLEKQWLDAQLRLTWQVHEKHKIGTTYTQQDFCACHDSISATTAPEAGFDRRFPTQRVVLLDWTAPITSRILLEASGIHRVERWGNMHHQTKDFALDQAMIGVLDQGGPIPNLNYRGRVGTYNNSWNDNFHYRFNVSYITGSHAFKVGMNNAHGYHDNTTYVQNPLSYRFNSTNPVRDSVTGNLSIPNQITLRALPHTQKNHVDQDLGLFAQDKWTINRATISLGIRYDHHATTFPEQELGPTFFTPTRDIRFAAVKNLNYHDITPKSQFAYDVFGNGRTALKVSLNKYLQGLGTTGGLSNANPIAVLATTSTRTWTDANANFRPDCNLFNQLAQDLRASGGDFCGVGELRFGQATPNTTYDPDLLRGWNKRFYNWEFSTGVQQEILPRLGMDVSFFRRSYGNFNVTDNRAVTAADYDTYSIVAPSDSRLPNSGGHTVEGLKNLKAAFEGMTDNYITLADNFGKRTEVWTGVDVNVNARLGNGLLVQGGTSTGRTAQNNCELLEELPETGVNDLPYCDERPAFLTQVKGAASYVIPRIDVSVAATFQYLPGPAINANWVINNTVVQPRLGRPMTGANTTVNLIEPGTEYGPGLTQLDLRFAKIVRLGGTRTTINFDLYNATNSNTIVTHNNTFSPTTTTWLQPQALVTARFFKFGVQFDW
jgi:hypothetical protein